MGWNTPVPSAPAVTLGPPSLADLTPPEALRRLELTIVRRLDGYLRGEHLGLLPGPGSELAEARLYRPGEDDVRHMDWAVTARTTHPHVRDVIADRELETWALADLTGSMHWGTALRDGHPVVKRDLAVAAVGTVAVLTGRLGDRFGGYLVTDHGTTRHPARSGRQAMTAMLRSMLSARPELAEPGRLRDAVTLATALERMAKAHPKRGLRVVVSDFLDPNGVGSGRPSWEVAMRRLAARHQVVAVEVYDPRELSLPDVGVVELADPETGQVIEVDTSSGKTREAFARVAAEHHSRVADSLRRCGAGHLVLRTDSDWVRDVARYVIRHRTQARVAGRVGPR